jgi:hypothetical protein
MAAATTRRRDPDAHCSARLIYYDDVYVGMIELRSGNPTATDPRDWHCRFCPGAAPPVGMLKEIGLAAEKIPTAGNPTVLRR